jgi:hypothetical protein
MLDQAQGVRRHSFEGVGEIKLRRDSSFVNTVEIDPGEARAEQSLGTGDILKEENRRP